MTFPGLVRANNLNDIVDQEKAWDNLGDGIATGDISITAPSLDLNFATNKSLVDDISGNNLITFSRASTGTFVGSNGLVQTAASGVARFDHDPATGESLGLLVEEARTNTLLYSDALDGGKWIDASGVLRVNTFINTAVAPDGLFTAKEVRSTTTPGTAYHSYYANFSAGTGNRNFSIFVKPNGITSITLYVDNANAVGLTSFNLTGNGAVTSGPGSFVKLSNGWWRLSTYGDITANQRADCAIYFTSTGDGSSGFYLWGSQLETGPFPTSYIPTTTSTVTRAADVASMTGTNFSSWYNPLEGTVVASASTNTDGYLVNFYGASSTQNRIALLRNSSGRGQLVVETSAVGQAAISLSGGDSVAIPSRLAGAYKTDNFYIAQGSSFTGSDTSGSPDTSIYRAAIGSLASSSFANGTIARLAYWPSRLNDKSLQYITQPSINTINLYSFSYSVTGKEVLALNSVRNTSTRDFIFIKGLLSSVQPRLNTASQNTSSGVLLDSFAMPKLAPTTSGNYFFSSGVTLSGVTTRINGTNALSIATSPFSGSTATAPLLFRELRPQANWRITEPMPSGTIASPSLAIPFETNDFVLFIKAGQN